MLNKIKTEKRFIFFGSCLLLVLLSLGLVTCFKLKYDSRIDDLIEQIEALQLQVNESEINNNFNVVSLANHLYGRLELPEIANKASAPVVGIKVTAHTLYTGRHGAQLFEQTSQGSGIIYNTDGYIITNLHVVEPFTESGGSQIEVYLADGRSAIATYIGDDKQNDLAVIKIDLENLPVAQFGLSSELRVGDFAMAIGNPLGIDLAGTVTVGIISGIERTVQVENVADSLIQTDAAINPGNSGGALVNENGQVIGINTVKIASAEIEGLGFAIPIDFVLPIAESIIEYGYVRDRPATGISGVELNDITAHYYSVPTGLLVTDVATGSAAEEAGIERNDIILEISGETVRSIGDINSILKQLMVGDTITIIYYRNGVNVSAKLILRENQHDSV